MLNFRVTIDKPRSAITHYHVVISNNGNDRISVYISMDLDTYR